MVLLGEMFNRIITRKKYLCRSRAVQIAVNLSAIDDWIEDMELPAGIQTHLSPVKDLLSWLQVRILVLDDISFRLKQSRGFLLSRSFLT